MANAFAHSLQVRFRDCDAMGHVNNAVYLTYLEETRFAYWRALWGSGAEGVEPPGIILARVEIDYRRPAKYGDVLTVRMSLEKLGRTSITSAYEIVDASGGPIASARTVIVVYDYALGRPVPIADAVRDRLLAF